MRALLRLMRAAAVYPVVGLLGVPAQDGFAIGEVDGFARAPLEETVEGFAAIGELWQLEPARIGEAPGGDALAKPVQLFAAELGRPEPLQEAMAGEVVGLGLFRAGAVFIDYATAPGLPLAAAGKAVDGEPAERGNGEGEALGDDEGELFWFHGFMMVTSGLLAIMPAAAYLHGVRVAERRGA